MLESVTRRCQGHKTSDRPLSFVLTGVLAEMEGHPGPVWGENSRFVRSIDVDRVESWSLSVEADTGLAMRRRGCAVVACTLFRRGGRAAILKGRVAGHREISRRVVSISRAGERMGC